MSSSTTTQQSAPPAQPLVQMGSGPLGAFDPAVLADADRLRESLSALIRVVQFRDRDRVCCFDVSVSQWYALEALVDRKGATVNDLSAALYLDKSTASRVANGLVKKGYLRRAANADDARSVVLEPTARGERLVGRIREELAGEYAALLADLDPEARESVARILGRLARAFAARVDVSGGTCCVVR